MKAIYLPAIAATTLLLSYLPNAQAACQCRQDKTFEKAVADATLVVTAQLNAVAPISGSGNIEGTFVPQHTFKGIVANSFKMTTAKDKDACGVPFKPGGFYLLILDGEHWTINSCDHGGLLPADLVEPMAEEVSSILKDPQAAVARADAAQQKEVWLKTQGLEIQLINERLTRCGDDFKVDAGLLQRHYKTVGEAKKLWSTQMRSRLANPKLLGILGAAFNNRAAALIDQEIKQGKLTQQSCDAFVKDNPIDGIVARLKTY